MDLEFRSGSLDQVENPHHVTYPDPLTELLTCQSMVSNLCGRLISELLLQILGGGQRASMCVFHHSNNAQTRLKKNFAGNEAKLKMFGDCNQYMSIAVAGALETLALETLLLVNNS